MQLRGWVAIVGVMMAACTSPTTAGPRFDLNDAWVGTYRGPSRVIQVRLEIATADGRTLVGTATLDSAEHVVAGRYEPPTVWFELASDTQGFDFVGEMLTSGLINGSGLLTSGESTEAGRLTLVRR